MHVSEQVGGETVGRHDFGLAVLARLRGQPLWAMVSQQEALCVDG